MLHFSASLLDSFEYKSLQIEMDNGKFVAERNVKKTLFILQFN